MIFATIIRTVFIFLEIMIFARVILSWVPQFLPYHPLRRAVFVVTEPILEPIRRILPPMGLDWSPLILLLLLSFVRSAIL